MHSEDKPGAREAQPSRDTGRTPNADMQPDDAGTPESGNKGTREAPTQPAMKQERKTDTEAGEGREGDA
ncbi:hypothetical protein [Ramlibacter humi]|uniref:Uncharacterized protein n=1 Tax=Ramlibacter humi TaxID=2530451 RepID=A0A4Z0BNJ6_9BURK|nr:hypothetical protein [Ramlibacter humi]TFZ00342.1 hypothetical protein EZ216_14700 [Ramlibacter humi]